MSDRPVRLTASGTGKHCLRGHLWPAINSGLYELEAFFDPSAESRAKVQEFAPAARSCKTFQDLLACDADAMIVCGPDDTHLEQAAQAIAAGFHVLVEKPVMVSVDQAGEFRRLLDDAAARNLVLTTCLPRRVEDRNYPYGWVLGALPGLLEEFGELLHLELDFSYTQPDVKGTWREGRSLLLDHFPHDGDFAYRLACAAMGRAPLPMRATCHADESQRYAVTGKIGGMPFMCHGSRYETHQNTYAERITLRFQCGICTIDVSHGDVELYWFADGRREFSHITPINEASGGYDRRSMALAISFAMAIQAGKGGHAYLSPRELAFSAEAGPELLESGLYVSGAVV